MKIKSIASNMVEYYDCKGNVVLYSYETPVAAILANNNVIKDETKYSVTTSKHINKWLGGVTPDVLTHKAFIEAIK